MRQFSGGADRIEGKSQFVGKNICRAAGQDAEGNPARCKAIDHFVDGPIAATNQYDVNAVRGRLAWANSCAIAGRVVGANSTSIPARRKMSAAARISRSRLAGRRPATGL